MGLFVPGFSLHSNVTYVAIVVLKIVFLFSYIAVKWSGLL